MSKHTPGRSFLDGPHGPYDFTGETAFLQKMGLNSYAAKTWQETDLGLIKLFDGKATVRVYVTCAPAKFWRFIVNDTEGRTWEISTGSGCITEYWPTIEMFAKSMVGVKLIAKAEVR